MKPTKLLGTTNLIAASLISALAGMAFCSNSWAQQVYRIVGADGRVTFSDQPPPSTSNAKVTVGLGSRAGTDSSQTALPFELRDVAAKYPVTLYTSSNCGPCISGKALLAGRGVPFTEKTVTTPEDSDGLQRLSGDTTLPFLTIGSQQLKGFSGDEWSQFLDAAGYPKTSVLPSGYSNPPASPLVAVKKADLSATAGGNGAENAGNATGNAVVTRRPTNRSAAPAAPAPNNNPAGIQF